MEVEPIEESSIEGPLPELALESFNYGEEQRSNVTNESLLPRNGGQDSSSVPDDAAEAEDESGSRIQKRQLCT